MVSPAEKLADAIVSKIREKKDVFPVEKRIADVMNSVCNYPVRIAAEDNQPTGLYTDVWLCISERTNIVVVRYSAGRYSITVYQVESESRTQHIEYP